MKTKFYFYLLAAFTSILFVSCNPDSIADEENPYQTEEGVRVSDLKKPTHG